MNVETEGRDSTVAMKGKREAQSVKVCVLLATGEKGQPARSFPDTSAKKQDPRAGAREEGTYGKSLSFAPVRFAMQKNSHIVKVSQLVSSS